MANYIKIPLAINPPRSFVVGALNNVAAATGGGTVSGTGATAVIAGNISTSGSGTGLTVTVTKGGDATIQSATITVTAAGESYKVGDTITIAADTTAGTTQWDEAIVYTIVAADLIAVEGSSTNEYALFDVDTLLAVDYQFGATDAMYLWQNETRFVRGANTVTTSNLRLTFDDTPALNDGVAGQDLSEAIIKAIESPNSVPTVEWSDGLEVISIDQN